MDSRTVRVNRPAPPRWPSRRSPRSPPPLRRLRAEVGIPLVRLRQWARLRSAIAHLSGHHVAQAAAAAGFADQAHLTRTARGLLGRTPSSIRRGRACRRREVRGGDDPVKRSWRRHSVIPPGASQGRQPNCGGDRGRRRRATFPRLRFGAVPRIDAPGVPADRR
ncbi:helix-turn-helix domain-containing protein [Nonomuraea africana]|uniref:helix-turn-helix domain-containing protein n=1 Tax=Nonomuraea africana TaxID=46171 RepID=UPI0033E9AFF0